MWKVRLKVSFTKWWSFFLGPKMFSPLEYGFCTFNIITVIAYGFDRWVWFLTTQFLWTLRMETDRSRVKAKINTLSLSFLQNSHIMAKIYIYRTQYTYHSWNMFKGLLDQKSKHNHRFHINNQDQFRVRVWLELTTERAVCRHVTYNFVFITVMKVTCVD